MLSKHGMTKLLGFSVFLVCTLILSDCVKGDAGPQGPPGPVTIPIKKLESGPGSGSKRGPFQATGIKIGEVTSDRAMVWTRLTLRPRRVPDTGPMVKIRYEKKSKNNSKDKSKKKSKKKNRSGKVEAIVYPDGVTVDDIRGAVPGARGDVRVGWRSTDEEAWRFTPWRAVDPERDFARQFTLKNLRSDGAYQVRVESRAGPDAANGQVLTGRFRTAPAADVPARVVFTVSTGQKYGYQDFPGGGFKIYGSMLSLQPQFFVHTGDIFYYDSLAKNLALARYHWQRTFSLPTNVDFHRQVTSYFIKDDHDTWRNDCWPTMDAHGKMGTFTFKQGLAVFTEQVPMGELTYRTVRWGRDLQIWLVEGRDYRSANNAPDGPDKTIWGATQKAWFKRTVAASDASFRVLFSPTPMVGPDRDNKNDNHANKGFQHEGRELRRFIATQKNMVVVCGDRHWQYVSVDPETSVREYSCGPASDSHAGGWKNEKRFPRHRYLNVIGGFLSGTVERKGGVPTLTFRHHGVDGAVLHEDRLTMK